MSGFSGDIYVKTHKYEGALNEVCTLIEVLCWLLLEIVFSNFSSQGIFYLLFLRHGARDEHVHAHTQTYIHPWFYSIRWRSQWTCTHTHTHTHTVAFTVPHGARNEPWLGERKDRFGKAWKGVLWPDLLCQSSYMSEYTQKIMFIVTNGGQDFTCEIMHAITIIHILFWLFTSGTTHAALCWFLSSIIFFNYVQNNVWHLWWLGWFLNKGEIIEGTMRRAWRQLDWVYFAGNEGTRSRQRRRCEWRRGRWSWLLREHIVSRLSSEALFHAVVVICWACLHRIIRSPWLAVKTRDVKYYSNQCRNQYSQS